MADERSDFTYLADLSFTNPDTTVFVADAPELEELRRFLALVFVEGQLATNETQSELLHSVQVDIDFISE